MGKKSNLTKTAATRHLEALHIEFKLFPYVYKDHGGTGQAAAALNVDEHTIIKTLVMETETKTPLIILMHGDCEVSLKGLARAMGVKCVTPCEAAVAQKHTGYQVGGISPFGTCKKLPVFAEHSIQDLLNIYINAGKRGLLARLPTNCLLKAIPVQWVSVAIV